MDSQLNQMIPYIVEGEILQVNEVPAEGDASGSMLNSAASFATSADSFPVRTMVTYVCKVTLYTGAIIVLPRVIDSSPLGGIDDYMQIRRRASFDISGTTVKSGTDLEAQIGDRVLIAFINGCLNQPIIIASMQHPLQVPRFDEGINPDIKPKMFWRYLGISQVIDEDGQMFVTHFGAPKIKYTGSVDAGAALAGAVSGLAGGLSSLSASSGYEGFSEGSETLDEPKSKAVVPQSFKYKTMYEFLKSGAWRVRDSIGQNIILDPASNHLVLTNNGVTSTDPLDETTAGSFDYPYENADGSPEDAEIIRLDKKTESIRINSRKITMIYSGDVRKDTTDGNFTHIVGGDEVTTISGDKTDDISGSVVRTITADLEETVSGNVSWAISGDCSKEISGVLKMDVTGAITMSTKDAFDIKITGNHTVDCKGNLTMKTMGDISIMDAAGSGIKVSSGKVEIGGKAAGLFDSVLKIEEQIEAIIDAIMQLTVPTGTGPSGPPMNAAAFTQVKIKLATIKGKLSTVKGSL